MADTANLSGVASSPLLGWADPWEPPVMEPDEPLNEDTLKELTRAIELEANARIYVLGQQFSFGITGASKNSEPDAATTANAASTGNTQNTELGRSLDMYL